ncbi:flagellar FlbD family protein [Alkaliphilus peptidifermentans]|uniref:Flagellar protein FlbD n=1 Tax=Alkaliphilus peptidifermentans DSM 18978 TaxID=1120976 RepID=A0A1G5DHE4_9FIRM|nr:flagellar FlbD family protein [Alkaliphilus peptidifermentans]SCY14046.1 flagellar protein FlbD [Alkaliphilus peptidifermentans DSM 18978]
MIKLKRLNQSATIVINAELIEMVEETPDTIIKLTNGTKMVVQNSADEVIDLVIEYKQKIYLGLQKNI